MIIALAQTNIIWEDKQANMEKVRRSVEKFARRYGKRRLEKLILFPEMSLTGFSMHTGLTAEEHKETVTMVSRLSMEFDVHIGIGWVKNCGALCENHYSVVNTQGEEILDFAKIHPFSFAGEDRYFQGGNDLPTCEIQNMQVGAAICYDLRFPEQFRELAERAELIVVPANWPEKRREHWMVLLRARAIENQCFVAGVNCWGDMDGQYYAGDSVLYGPDGFLLEPLERFGISKGTLSKEWVAVYHIQNTVQAVRDAFPVWKDKRAIGTFADK